MKAQLVLQRNTRKTLATFINLSISIFTIIIIDEKKQITKKHYCQLILFFTYKNQKLRYINLLQ